MRESGLEDSTPYFEDI